MKKLLCVLLVVLLWLSNAFAEIESIISGYYISTSYVMALGAQDKLVGIEAKAKTREIYALAAPELMELPGVGSLKQLDVETVLSLNADLIILAQKQSKDAETLKEMGCNVLLVNPESYEQLLETVNVIAEAIGADSFPLLEYYAEKEAMLAALRVGKATPKTYLAGNSSMLNTAGHVMYQNTLIEMAGGENVAADIDDGYWAEISYEQLLNWNPEVIIIAANAEYTAEDILTDSLLQEVEAVRTGRVYALPASPEAWDSPVPATILGSMWIASKLYPEEYTNEMFEADANEFYERFYGFAPY